MTHRSTMPNRPWLNGAQYDKYSTPGAVHYDLFAYEDAISGYTYFDIQATAKGRDPLARSVFAYDPAFEYWRELTELPVGLAPLYWRRATHDRFKRAHGRLLALCTVPHGYTTRHILAHYVKPYDADPWPRNTLNTYAPPQYGEGKRPGRPRTRKAFDGSPMTPAPTDAPRIDPKDAQAINILMGVDVLDVLRTEQ